MNGTFLARRHTRRLEQFGPWLTGPDGVLTALFLSAAVTGGAAYVAVDYITSPFAPQASDIAMGAPPRVNIVPPRLDAQLDMPVTITAPTFSDPDLAIPARLAALPDAPTLDRPALAGPRRTSPVATPRPTDDQIAATVPQPRPDGLASADTDFTATVAAALAEIDAGGPADAASTFSEPGLTVSIRPDMRPDNWAAVVASAREPDTAETVSGVEVARAAAPEVDVAPAPLQPIALGPLRNAANPCHARLARGIPNRSRSAPTGSAVIAGLDGIGGADRDARIVQAAFAGNVPNYLRQLRPVSFSGVTSGGQEAVVTICVTPDYLAIGSDADHVRVPLGLPAALQMADQFDMMLPTPRMVDAIYAQADLRLRPQPMTPGAQMTSTRYFLRHDALVDDQMARAGGRLGILVAGQKKDVVIANRLSSNPGRVAIYGWHQASGSPIQPLSTVHGAQYADYSHGIRLISRTAFVNGRAVDLGALLTDARYAALLNSDGPLTGRAVQIAALR
ncbi:MAG: hypothetical protein AAF689_05635 [Pseudomonadota bacterium]